MRAPSSSENRSVMAIGCVMGLKIMSREKLSERRQDLLEVPVNGLLRASGPVILRAYTHFKSPRISVFPRKGRVHTVGY